MNNLLGGQMHGFFTQVGVLTATDEAIEFIAGALRDQLPVAARS